MKFKAIPESLKIELKQDGPSYESSSSLRPLDLQTLGPAYLLTLASWDLLPPSTFSSQPNSSLLHLTPSYSSFLLLTPLRKVLWWLLQVVKQLVQGVIQKLQLQLQAPGPDPSLAIMQLKMYILEDLEGYTLGTLLIEHSVVSLVYESFPYTKIM